MFVITVIVFVIFLRHPALIRPGPSRAHPQPPGVEEVRAQLGLDRSAIQYVIMMKKIFISRYLVVLLGSGRLRSCRSIFAAALATLSLVFGATIIWIVMAIVMAQRPPGRAAPSTTRS